MAVTSLVPPPLFVGDLNASDEPVDGMSNDESLDSFTRWCWQKWEDQWTNAIRGRTFRSDGVMPDSWYVHMLRELNQPCRLKNSALYESQPEMCKAILSAMQRNQRYVMFDVKSETELAGGQRAVSHTASLLYVAKESAQLKPTLAVEECYRVVPISQLRRLLEALHIQWGHKKTSLERHILERYKGLPRSVVQEFGARHCERCVESAPYRTGQMAIQQINAREPRERYVADLIDMSDVIVVPGMGSYRYILHMIDHASKFRFAAALPNKTAEMVEMHLSQWFSLWGKPQIFQTDNGGEFAGVDVVQFCRIWGVKKTHSRPRHPQTQGVIERANRDLRARIAFKLQEEGLRGKGWYYALAPCTSIHNQGYTKTTKLKPVNVFIQVVDINIHTPLPFPPSDVDEWKDDEEDFGMRFR